MIAANAMSPSPQDQFLALLPRIERHGRVVFRNCKCPHKRQEAIAEMVALAWKWFLRLVDRGKDPAQFPSALATFAAKGVQNWRRLRGQENGKDVLSPRAQQRHNFVIGPLPEGSGLADSLFEEALRDNSQTPVPDQVCFRQDFPAWLCTRTDRDRRLIEDMARNERTQDLSRKYGISPGRIAQLRREFHLDWSRFQDEDSEPRRRAPAPAA
jgi:hypothetical protein